MIWNKTYAGSCANKSLLLRTKDADMNSAHLRLLLILTIGLVVYSQIGCNDDSPEECSQKFTEIRREFDIIEPPKGVVAQGDRSGPSCNYGYATVGQVFSSDMEFEQIRIHYENGLKNYGWNLDSDNEIDQISFSKDGLIAFIKYERFSIDHRFYFAMGTGDRK